MFYVGQVLFKELTRIGVNTKPKVSQSLSFSIEGLLAFFWNVAALKPKSKDLTEEH